MNLHVDYACQPVLERRLLNDLRKPLKKLGKGNALYVTVKSPLFLVRFLRRCLYRLHMDRAYVFYDGLFPTGRTLRKLSRLHHRREIELVIDAKGKMLDKAMIALLKRCPFPIVINHCPEPIEGLKTHRDEAEETLSLLTSLACYSGLHYRCDFTSCLGNTLFVDETGACRHCHKEPTPFANVKDGGIYDKLRSCAAVNNALKTEVPFRKACMASCPYFVYCKGRCMKEKDRCLIKTLASEVDAIGKGLSLKADNLFDRRNAIHGFVFDRGN